MAAFYAKVAGCRKEAHNGISHGLVRGNRIARNAKGPPANQIVIVGGRLWVGLLRRPSISKKAAGRRDLPDRSAQSPYFSQPLALSRCGKPHRFATSESENLPGRIRKHPSGTSGDITTIPGRSRWRRRKSPTRAFSRTAPPVAYDTPGCWLPAPVMPYFGATNEWEPFRQTGP